MIRSYGETEYRSYVRLSSVAEVEKIILSMTTRSPIKYRIHESLIEKSMRLRIVIGMNFSLHRMHL